MKLTHQISMSIKYGLSKTQKQQGRTANVVSISGPHPYKGESQEGDSGFLLSR